MFAVAVGGTDRDRVNRAEDVKRFVHIKSYAKLCSGRPWTKIQSLACQLKCRPGVAYPDNLILAKAIYLCGHVDPIAFRAHCDTYRPDHVAVLGPGFNYLDSTDPPGAFMISALNAPSYTRDQWKELFNHLPEDCKALRYKLLGAFLISRSPALIRTDSRGATDAFLRWANITPSEAEEFEEGLALELDDVGLYQQLCGLRGSPTYLTDVLALKGHALQQPEEVGQAAATVLEKLWPGHTLKEYDAWGLHLFLRGLAQMPTVLTHDFHYKTMLDILRGAPDTEYLQLLRPDMSLAIWHDHGIDPNLDDLLALKFAEAINASCSCT